MQREETTHTIDEVELEDVMKELAWKRWVRETNEGRPEEEQIVEEVES